MADERTVPLDRRMGLFFAPVYPAAEMTGKREDGPGSCSFIQAAVSRLARSGMQRTSYTARGIARRRMITDGAEYDVLSPRYGAETSPTPREPSLAGRRGH